MTSDFNAKKILFRIGVSILLIALLVLIFHQSKNLLAGPTISITSPLNGSTLSSSYLQIEGLAKRVSFITLNDRQIYVDEQGNISEQLLLQRGYNIISLKAIDRFNRKVEKRLEIMYQ